MSPDRPAAPGEYRLDVGGAVIGLRCAPVEFADALAHWFGRPSAAGEALIRLDLELVPHADAPALPRSLVTSKTLLPGGGFDIGDGLITGHYDPATRQGAVRAKAILVRGHLLRILEQLFYQVFWSARAAGGPDGFLLHSSAVVADGRGFVFVGPSEAGKSTVARLSAAHHVLGDEMHLLRRDAAGWSVVGTPFNGLFRGKRPGEAPVAGIYLLHQADHHGVRPAPALDAVPALAAEIAPPVGLDEVPDAETLPRMFDLAAELAAAVPLKYLDFLPDDGFWQVLGADAPPNPTGHRTDGG